jgi:transcriptional regulator with XRE-family HTH domain
LVAASQDLIASQIAERVRTARGQRGWTLDQFAARSGLSRRLLVGIEQTDANPSLSTLLKLATALGISLTELLDDQSEDRPVGLVTQDEAITLWSTDAGSLARLLVSRGPLELWAWTLEPGDRRDSNPHRPGAVELLAVQDGTLTLEVGDDRIEVRAGDNAWFEATHPHAYKNETANPTKFTLVVLEPT